MKLTRKKLMQLIQEHVWVDNKDVEDITSMRKHLSTADKKLADDLFFNDPKMSKLLGGLPPDIQGPERPTWNIDIGEPDWNVSDVPFMLETILDELEDDTSIDEIARTLNDDWGINQQYTRDLLTPLDDKGNLKKGSYIPVMNEEIHYRLLKKWLYEQLQDDDRFNLFRDGTLQIKPDYTDYGYY
jgi:hypothetical protein